MKSLSLFELIKNYIFSYFKSPEISKGVPKVEKKKYTFNFPERVPTAPDDPDILIYSAYLKTLGVDQDLKIGDWFYRYDDEVDAYILKLNAKETVDNIEDFEATDAREFIRLVALEEALDALKKFSYVFSEDALPIEENEDGSYTINIYNMALDISLKVTCASLHATVLKALYLAATIFKTNVDCNNSLVNNPLFGDGDEN
jgi:hypothetical protein